MSSGYLNEDTIIAAATAVGGPISMIRVSGSAAFSLVEAVLKNKKLAGFNQKHLFTSLYGREGVRLDEVVLNVYQSPKSYTGEDVVEIQCHGSEFVTVRILEELLFRGARLALPGEFSFRAVKNGKMSLSQAEAVSDLITASNGEAATLALEKLEGLQSKWAFKLSTDLKDLAALGELGIDFSDQDIDELSLKKLKMKIRPMIEQLGELKDSFSRGKKIQSGIKTVFLGLPNSGKSSLFNAFLGEDRSIVTEVAGTTRDVIREHLTLQSEGISVTLRLEDTAGLRSSNDIAETFGIERTLKAAHESDLILLVIDSNQDHRPLLNEWKKLGAPLSKTFAIITKSDLQPDPKKVKEILTDFGLTTRCETSTLTGDGIHETIRMICQFCSKWVRRKSGEMVLTKLEHFQAVENGLDHLKRAENAPEMDLFAADVRQALNALSPVIGETLPDDILGKIFSQFCIGK